MDEGNDIYIEAWDAPIAKGNYPGSIDIGSLVERISVANAMDCDVVVVHDQDQGCISFYLRKRPTIIG